MRIVERKWKYRGLSCLVTLDEHFVEEWFSGYVAVPKGHPYWGKNHSIVKVDVHGGLTFAKQGSDDSIWKDKNLWWFGFHCAHPSDDTHRGEWKLERPHPARPKELPLQRWTIDEVSAETEKLADQLAAHNLR
jgi:hypothetical protein